MFQYITHILLDAARMEGEMSVARELNKQNDSLYRGGSEESLSDVAPYIFTYKYDTEFANWYNTDGWGNAWGVGLKSSSSLQSLHSHFRKFLMVQTEDGRELYFRFYDPRVLRIFLPICDKAQLQEFFGPVEYYIVEDEEPAYALRYRLENSSLVTDRLPIPEAYQQQGSSIVQSSNTLIQPSPLNEEPDKSQNENIKINSGWKLFD